MKNVPYLIREQWKVLFLPYDRDQVTLGVAGSGKTVMAMYRAKYLNDLIEISNNKQQRVIFLTVNRDVNNDIAATLKGLSHVTVNTFYSFFQNFINEHPDEINDPNFDVDINNLGQFQNNAKLTAITRMNDVKLMRQSIQDVQNEYPDESLWNKPSYEKSIIQEIQWMQANSVPYDDDGKIYTQIERIGRKAFVLGANQRALLFVIYNHYFNLRTQGFNSRGPKLFNFSDIYRILPHMDIKPAEKVDYIIIDEVQDVTPAMFQALNCIKTPQSRICVFGDLSQNIFGQRISWKSQGITITKGTFRIYKNYRNTKPISELAKRVIDYKHETYDLNNDGNVKDDGTFLEPVVAQKRGELPILINTDESMNVISTLMKRGVARDQTSVIICFNAKDIIPLREQLAQYEIEVSSEYNPDESRNGKVYILSINAVKGLEFDNVVLYNINTTSPNLARNEIINLEDGTLNFNEMNEDELSGYYSKLYVSITRARLQLVMTYKGETVPEAVTVACGREVLI